MFKEIEDLDHVPFDVDLAGVVVSKGTESALGQVDVVVLALGASVGNLGSNGLSTVADGDVLATVVLLVEPSGHSNDVGVIAVVVTA